MSHLLSQLSYPQDTIMEIAPYFFMCIYLNENNIYTIKIKAGNDAVPG